MSERESIVAYQPLENYGFIGDLHTVALVGVDGSIDYMCFPHFDSPTVFAALLDDDLGGRFKIAPSAEGFRCKQMYLPDTNVLLTRFLSVDGLAEVTDFMPVEDMRHSHILIRRVKAVRGPVDLRLECRPRFDYARVEHQGEGGWRDRRARCPSAQRRRVSAARELPPLLARPIRQGSQVSLAEESRRSCQNFTRCGRQETTLDTVRRHAPRSWTSLDARACPAAAAAAS